MPKPIVNPDSFLQSSPWQRHSATLTRDLKTKLIRSACSYFVPFSPIKNTIHYIRIRPVRLLRIVASECATINRPYPPGILTGEKKLCRTEPVCGSMPCAEAKLTLTGQVRGMSIQTVPIRPNAGLLKKRKRESKWTGLPDPLYEYPSDFGSFRISGEGNEAYSFTHIEMHHPFQKWIWKI